MNTSTDPIKMKINKKEVNWKILESYFEGQHLNRLVRHQLESYNHLVEHQLKQTINMFNPVEIYSEDDKHGDDYKLKLIINFDNFQIYRPQIHENNGARKLMFPHEARMRNFTYASAMTIDFNIKNILNTALAVELFHNFTLVHDDIMDNAD